MGDYRLRVRSNPKCCGFELTEQGSSITISALEPTLPLRMQELWNYDSKAVGLVYLAMAVPTVFSQCSLQFFIPMSLTTGTVTYLSGWTSDKFGAAIITFICFIAASLWYLCLMSRVLWFFIMSLIISSECYESLHDESPTDNREFRQTCF